MLGKDGDNREHRRNNTREAKERDKQRQQRHEEDYACILEIQLMEKEHRAQVEERKQRATEEIQVDALDADAQWRNQTEWKNYAYVRQPYHKPGQANRS